MIKIVFCGKEDECFKREKELIEKHGRVDKGTGILTNMTDGGEGVSGRIYSREDRIKISKRFAGSGNPMFGKERTKEDKMKISQTRKERIDLGIIVPLKHSKKWKERLRKNNAGGKATSKPIYQIDLKGNVMRRWNSASCAAKSLKTSKSNICSVANKNTIAITAHGFYWRWVGDKDIVDNMLTNVNDLNKKKNKKHKIKQIDIRDGEEVIWDSLTEASIHPGFSMSSIHRALKSNKTYKNYNWEYYVES